MNPLHLKIDPNARHSFNIRKDVLPCFYNIWHYHEELELTLILKSEGMRYVGDSISAFSDKDLVLVGENTPHVWRNSETYYKGFPELYVEAIVVHFRKDFAGSDFLELPEMRKLKEMFQESRCGLCFGESVIANVQNRLLAMLSETPFRQWMLFLEVLGFLAETTDYESLSSEGFLQTFSACEKRTIDKVFDFIYQNYRSEIEIQKIASLANMTPTSFCRFFKQHTRKTLSQYVNEVRISSACRLLIEDKLGITQIGYECGYNNPSYFNRQFSSIKGVTPSEYRQLHVRRSGIVSNPLGNLSE